MKKEKNYDLIIGVLLIMPIYMAILVSLRYLGFEGDNYILFPTLMYLPIILGILLSLQYKKKSRLPIILIIMIILSVIFYYDTYFIEHEGWDGLDSYIMWLISTAVTKVTSCVYYGKIVGWKKALIFLGIYILIVSLSFAVGFWE